MTDDTWQPRCRPPSTLVQPVPLDPTGRDGPTRHQARNASWRRTTHGFYVPSDTDSTVIEQRIVEQSMRLGATGAVTGWAALRMYGAAFFDGLEPDGRTSIPVSLITPRRLRDGAASVVSQAGRGGDRVWIVQGVRCFGVERSLTDEIRRRDDLREAVVAIDMACAARLTSIARVRSYARRRLRGRVRRLVLAAADLADEHSRSPMESRMRLVWVLDAGLPRPACNRIVYSLDGDVLGCPDLLDVDVGVGGEYNGAFHRDRSRHREDVARAERFQRHGLELFAVVAGDTVEEQVDRMLAARERALERGRGRGSWTITPPRGAWAPPEMSLDQELGLHGWESD